MYNQTFTIMAIFLQIFTYLYLSQSLFLSVSAECVGKEINQMDGETPSYSKTYIDHNENLKTN